MKVRMRSHLTGLIYGQVAPKVGETMVIPDDNEAARYCELGYCDPVAEKERSEKAVPVEKSEQRASKDTGKRRADTG